MECLVVSVAKLAQRAFDASKGLMGSSRSSDVQHPRSFFVHVVPESTLVADSMLFYIV